MPALTLIPVHHVAVAITVHFVMLVILMQDTMQYQQILLFVNSALL